MILIIVFATVLLIMFMSTGVQTLSRQIENQPLEKVILNLTSNTSLKEQFELNEYIHSIWSYRTNDKSIYTSEKVAIPNEYLDLQWMKDGVDVQMDGKWAKPFRFEETMLIPFIKSVKNGCVGYMVPIYL